MKKLLVLAAVAVMAMGAQADFAYYYWNAYTEPGHELTGPAGVNLSGKAYVFKDGGTDPWSIWEWIYYSNDDVWSSITKYPEAVLTLNNGAIVNDEGKDYARFTTYNETLQESLFVVFRDGDNYFIDMIRDLPATESDTGLPYSPDWSFGKDAIYGNVDCFQDESAYAGGGWYSTAVAPEPTSGLLLLLGVAGLALKRKRA